MFPAFETRDIETSCARIRLRIGGNGPPLLLLHGNPQTSAMWRHVAPALADRFTCICPDLRGYGFSSKPPSGERQINYSKREMARDMVEVMEALGHTRFNLCGHDRGGRVAHRLAHDWPDRVTRLCVLDIAPTREMYANTTDAFARAYWHWFFMILPNPIPERMFGADPEFTLRAKLGGFTDLSVFDGAWEEYLEAFRNPETIRATCDDYRAAATIDIEHDDAETGKLPSAASTPSPYGACAPATCAATPCPAATSCRRNCRTGSPSNWLSSSPVKPAGRRPPPAPQVLPANRPRSSARSGSLSATR
jgi:haloacetate dehalogenase